MKEALVIIYTPDMGEPEAKDYIQRLTQTDLSRAELLVYDRCHTRALDGDDGAGRDAVLKNLSEFAGQRRVVMLDTNTKIEDPKWLDKLLDAADDGGRRS